jgi:hypothetical protein
MKLMICHARLPISELLRLCCSPREAGIERWQRGRKRRGRKMYQVAEASQAEEWRSPSSSCNRPPRAAHRGERWDRRREGRGSKRANRGRARQRSGRAAARWSRTTAERAGEMYLRRCLFLASLGIRAERGTGAPIWRVQRPFPSWRLKEASWWAEAHVHHNTERYHFLVRLLS